jgi:hypothetical protein
MSKFQNKNWEIAREKRLKDFEERKCDVVKNCFKTDGFDSEFVTIHPLADEDWWFEKFSESPAICEGVDLYWKFDGDVAFVEIYSRDVSAVELSARWRSGMLYLAAKVKDNLIYSTTVNFVLKSFWEKHLENNLFRKYYLKRKYHEIT